MHALPFELRVRHSAEATTIRLAGEIDVAAALELTSRLERIAESCNSDLLFDLREVTLIDSEGLRMILKAFDRALRRGRCARVTGLSERAQRIISIAGVGAMLGCDDQCRSSTPQRFSARTQDPKHSPQQ